MRVLMMGAPTANGYKAFGLNSNISGGGWVENLVRKISKIETVELYVCFYAEFVECVECSVYDDIKYYALPIRVKGLSACNKSMIEDISLMLQDIEPDVVHIIGTEREHNLRLLELAGAESTIFSITGLVSYIAEHYYAGIVVRSFWRKTFGDWLRKGGPVREKKMFQKFGLFERETLQLAKYVFGRTSWDKACVKQINPNIEYTYCGEILNPIYYKKQWDAKKAIKHRIFVSQASYPIKGIHQLFKAFQIILRKYPDSEIVVAGPNILNTGKLIDRIKRTTYARYLMKLLKKLEIPKEKIIYTGVLNAEEMAEQYLQANVFVLPSVIENSPNSLGEAMMLGVPCVASCVGGVQDMVHDKQDAYIYPYDEYYMLAYYIGEIFENLELAIKMGEKARQTAKARFDEKEIVKTTMNVYQHIIDKKGIKNE